MSRIKMLILFVLILLLVLIFFQNREAVEFHFLWWKFQTSLFILPVVSIISIIVGFMLAKILSFGKKKKIKDQLKEKILPSDK